MSGTSHSRRSCTPALYVAGVNQRIDAVRQHDPRALAVAYFRYYGLMRTGNLPLYSQHNLALDQHVYGAPTPNLQARIASARAHGLAYLINEYGGRHYNPTAVGPDEALATSADVGLLYFEAGNLINNVTAKTPPPYALDTNGTNGTMVRDLYQRLLGPLAQN